MAGFVRVSGYSKKDLDDAREEGYEEAVSDLLYVSRECYSWNEEAGTKTTSYTIPNGYSGYVVCSVNILHDGPSGSVSKNGSDVTTVNNLYYAVVEANAGDYFYAECAGVGSGSRSYPIRCHINAMLHKD